MGALVLAALTIALTQTAPAREGARTVTVGTAAVSGTITTDAQKPQPLRKARVTLTASDINFNRTIVTDETGRFAFTNLPAGRFTLNAMKEAYVTMAFGSRQPGRPGTSIVLSDGQRLQNLTLRLPRGAVISGTVTDFMGRPLPDVTVAASQYGFLNGVRRLLGQGTAQTDDRGAYRMYGLRPGQYVVSASPDRMFMMFSNVPDLLELSEADVNRALQDTTATSTDGRLGRPVGYTPIYFPNVTAPEQASTIPVAAGDERTGIDMQLALVASGRVEGVVSYVGGALPPTVQVTLVSANRGAAVSSMDGLRMTRAGAGGTFQFGSLPPGEYVVAVRANAPGDKTGQSALWATERVFVDGGNSPTVTLELRPGFTVTGRVEFETAATPPDPRGWRIGLGAAATEVTLGVNGAELKADGTFTIAGVTPGRYRLQPTAPGSAVNDRWMPKLATLANRDVLDDPIDLNSDVSGISVVLTDRISQIGGTLQDASGAPASDYHIIVFPSDRALWVPQSRRIHAVRPAANGSYVVKRLPPGEYLLAAVIDVEPGEWTDPAFLERMAAAAMKFTMAEGEQKVQDLKLGAR